MSSNMVLTESEAIELLAFLITAARTQIDEPPDYAPMRMLTAAGRLREFILDRVSPEGHQFLKEFLNPAPKSFRQAGLEQYSASLDELCRKIARHLIGRSGFGGKVV
ncbi:hypothetical protein FIM12_00995 [SAR202 cluster bacterium AD-804-J14_MRT_500m]|nr:hypothetical protein [SAR202 cluster bacterium AD-804-J14_MRT_500m]